MDIVYDVLQVGITKAELARQLGVSKAYITMLCNGERKASQQLVNRIQTLEVNNQIQSSGLKIRVSPVRFWASAPVLEAKILLEVINIIDKFLI